MKIKYIYLTLLLLLSLNLSAQTLDEAKAMYLEGKFAESLPIFKQELKANPQDPALNQWYGVCLYETGGNLLLAEQHIKTAADAGIQDAFLYLGNVYAKTYRFKEAESEFAKYAKLKRRDKTALAKVEKSKADAEQFRRFALRTENVQIIDSTVVDKRNLLAPYKLSAGIGELAWQSGKELMSTFVNGTDTKMYYAQKIEGKISLFSEEKLLDGYANPRMLSANNFSLSGDINYPSVLSDGVTIYFAGKDASGIGGYDLYVTRYNLNNDSYLAPERLSAPFNSSFNDYLLVIDEEKGVGWFASDRFQPEGKVCVYTFIPNSKVEMVENEDEEAIIKRAYISAIAATRKPGTDYSRLIALAKKDVEKRQESKRDFIFVINDANVYNSLSDFRDDRARQSFEKATDLRSNYENMLILLKEKRQEYSKSSKDEQARMSYAILDMEEQLPKLYTQIEELEQRARNQEIQYLKK